MTQGTAPPSKKLPLIRRIRDTAAAYPAAVAIGVYALVAIAATVTAYVAIFTVFASYDDEGTLLVTLKAFVNGDALYRDIWSVYGPFYYELFGGFFSLTGLDVTTDIGRSIVIVVWVGTSLMFGLAAQRLTGRLALGVAGMVATFSVLVVLANEPMHPQGLCVLLLSAFVLLAACGPTRRIAWAGAACGALLAALVLTKANVGVFAVAAAVLAAVLTVEPLSRQRWLRWLVIAAFLVMPLAILNRDLDQGWVREMLIFEVLAASAVIVAAWPSRSRAGEGDAGLTRWLIAAVAGFVAAFVAIIAIVVATGPSPADVYDGVVTQAFGIRDILVIPLSFPAGAVVDWAVAALAAAALASRVLPGNAEKPSLWPGLVRGAVGLTILFTVAHIVPFGINPSSANPDTLPLVLAWVAAIAPIGAREAPYKRFLRVLLPALAVAETLQVYPVAGSQMGIAAVTFVPVAALCLADALVELRAWSSARGSAALERFGEVSGVATAAIAGMFVIGAIILPGASNLAIYQDQPKLALPGADLLHPSAESGEIYTDVVNLLHENHCSTFISYPSVNSIYLWSELPAPPPQIPNAWMYSLDDAQQQEAVNHLRASRRPCLIRNDELAASYLHGEPPPDTPLVRYVFNDFKKPVATAGPFEFSLPKQSATAP